MRKRCGMSRTPRKRDVFLQEVGKGMYNGSKIIYKEPEIGAQSYETPNILCRLRDRKVRNGANLVCIRSHASGSYEMSKDGELAASEVTF